MVARTSGQLRVSQDFARRMYKKGHHTKKWCNYYPKASEKELEWFRQFLADAEYDTFNKVNSDQFSLEGFPPTMAVGGGIGEWLGFLRRFLWEELDCLVSKLHFDVDTRGKKK